MTFKEKLALLFHLTIEARGFYDIWYVYEGPETKKTVEPVINRFKGFFWFDDRAHFTSAVMYLYQVFDTPREDRVTLCGLIREAGIAGVPKEKIDEANGLVKQAEAALKGLTILRHNLFAHRTSQLGYGDVFAKANISAPQLRGLTETSLRVLNIFATSMGLEAEHFREFGTTQLLGILELLRQS